MAYSNNTSDNIITTVEEVIHAVTEEELVNPEFEPKDEFYRNPACATMPNLKSILDDYNMAKLALSQINALKRNHLRRIRELEQQLARDIQNIKDGYDMEKRK